MQRQEAMEGALREEDQQPQLRYEMRGMGHTPEDILFCVDADVEVNVEMKVGGGKVVAGGGGGGGGMSRLDAIKQAILLFVHSKLTVHPQHKFAFATLHNTASWVMKELFLSQIELDFVPRRSSVLRLDGCYEEFDIVFLSLGIAKGSGVRALMIVENSMITTARNGPYLKFSGLISQCFQKEQVYGIQAVFCLLWLSYVVRFSALRWFGGCYERFDVLF